MLMKARAMDIFIKQVNEIANFAFNSGATSAMSPNFY